MSKSPNQAPTIDVELAFDPEARHAAEEAARQQARVQADMDAYVQRRESTDLPIELDSPSVNDEYHRTQLQDAHANKVYDETLATNPKQKKYEDMTTKELARKFAEAEVNNDFTMVNDLAPILEAKAEAYAHKSTTRRGLVRVEDGVEVETTPKEIFTQMITTYKDKEVARLTGQPTEDPKKNTPTTTDEKPKRGTNTTSILDVRRNQENGTDTDTADDTPEEVTALELDDTEADTPENTISTNEKLKENINIKSAQAESLSESKNTMLRDDRLQAYGVFESEGEDTKEHSQTAADAIHNYFSHNLNDYKSKEDAVAAMMNAFNTVPDAINVLETQANTYGTAVEITTIDGQTYAIIGSTGGSRVYLDSDDGNFSQLACTEASQHSSGLFFVAVLVNPDDRLVICSENVTDDNSAMRFALDQENPFHAAYGLTDYQRDLGHDNSVIVIDIDPTPEDEYVLTDEEALELEAEEAALAAEAAAAEDPTLVLDSAATEIRGPKKDLNLYQRAKVLAGRVLTGDIFGKETKFKKTKTAAVAALGIGAIYLAYRGIGGGRGIDTSSISTTPASANSGHGAADVLNSATIPSGRGAEQAAAAAEAWTDTVNPGDGITQSFMDYAQSHGSNISPERAFQLFNDARESGLINADNISNISPQDVVGGVGFNGPGQTTLSPDIIEFLDKQLNVK